MRLLPPLVGTPVRVARDAYAPHAKEQLGRGKIQIQLQLQLLLVLVLVMGGCFSAAGAAPSTDSSAKVSSVSSTIDGNVLVVPAAASGHLQTPKVRVQPNTTATATTPHLDITYDASTSAFHIQTADNVPLLINGRSIAAMDSLLCQMPLPSQELETEGAHDAEYFEIDGERFLAVANAYVDERGMSYLYKWDAGFGLDGGFVVHQQLQTDSPRDFEYAEFSPTERYLFVANFRFSGGSTLIGNSEVWKYNGTHFLSVREITTTGNFDWETFSFGGKHFAAYASWGGDASDHDRSSPIYEFDTTTNTLTSFGTISTHTATDLCAFVIGGVQYLAVANAGTGHTSEIFKLQGGVTGSFVHHQDLSLGNNVHFFNIGSDALLSVTRWQDAAGRYDTQTMVYRATGGSANFVLLQALDTFGGAYSSTAYVIGTRHYLAVASSRRSTPDGAGATLFDPPSSLWAWDSANNEFVLRQTIRGFHADQFVHFAIGEQHYLVMVNEGGGRNSAQSRAGKRQDVFSHVFRWNGCRF